MEENNILESIDGKYIESILVFANYLLILVIRF